jgi:hypothetical protein
MSFHCVIPLDQKLFEICLSFNFFIVLFFSFCINGVNSVINSVNFSRVICFNLYQCFELCY